MRQILNDIWISKKIFIMLFFGFLLTILPILIALSTQSYYDEHFYQSKNGYFNYYYALKMDRIQEEDLLHIQELANSTFEHSSVLTATMAVTDPKIGSVQVIGLLNDQIWSPPLLEGRGITSDQDKEIVTGKLIADRIGMIHVLNQEYQVKGIAGINKGRDMINVYNSNLYVFLNELPEQIKREIAQKGVLPILVRSNRNPEIEMNRFISELQQYRPEIKVTIENLKPTYEKQKRSRQGVKEVMSYPYKLVMIALLNCVNVSYLWIYLKRKEFSLRKALGASNLNLFAHIFSQLFLCAVLAAGCSFFIQLILSKLSIKIVESTTYFISLDFNQTIIGILATFAVALLTSVIPLLHILRIEPAKALKE